MNCKRKLAITGVLVLVLLVAYAFASGFFSIPHSSSLSQTTLDLISSSNSTIPDYDNSTLPTSTPTDKPVPTPTSTPSPTPIPIPVDFTIKGSGNALTVYIDLNDGMSREEAVWVAEQLIVYAHSSSITYEVKSAEVNSAGVWNVSLPWGAVSPDGYQEDHGHFFVATIDPSVQTADFATCF